MCDNGSDTPFCTPQDGAQLRTGETAEITWDPLFFTTDSFSSTPSTIFIQADFAIPSDGPPETAGFTSSPLDPSIGTFPWPILDTYLPANSNSTSATLSIAAPLTEFPTNGTFTRIGAGTLRFPGPQVHILRGSTTDLPNPATGSATAIPSASSSLTSNTPQQNQQQQQQLQETQFGTPSPLAIALPIALGLLTAMLMVAYALLKRHRPDLLARFLPFCRSRVRVNGIWPGSGDRIHGAKPKEYGEGQGRAVRLRGRDVEIRVVRTDPSLEELRRNAVRMAGHNAGGNGYGANVFQEEVRRQEMERDFDGRV